MNARRRYTVNDDWDIELQCIRENDPHTTYFDVPHESDIRIMTEEEWEDLGKDISNNTHLTNVYLSQGTLNEHKMSCLFQGLTRSSSIKRMSLYENQFSINVVQNLVPFLQNANNLMELNLSDNNIESEGFNLLFRELRDSPIEELNCSNCGINSIEIDTNHIPRQLKDLYLYGNMINADGCRGLAKLLQANSTLEDLNLCKNQVGNDGVEILAEALRKNKSLTNLDLNFNKILDDGVAALAAALKGNATLTVLHLNLNKIGDDGVAALVDALQSNATLNKLYLRGNTGISQRGKTSLLKLVIDISSIEAIMQSNHTLTEIKFLHCDNKYDFIQHLIDGAVAITRRSPEVAGREKVRRLLVDGTKRAQLADLQEVTNSVYSEIDSLYMPEVLALMNRYSYHGGKELFPALKSTMTGLLSRVDMKLCIQEQMARHEARIEQQMADCEARISEHKDQIAQHEERIKATISERDSMMDEHGIKMQELNARLAAMEESDRNMNQDTKTQSNKRRRVDG